MLQLIVIPNLLQAETNDQISIDFENNYTFSVCLYDIRYLVSNKNCKTFLKDRLYTDKMFVYVEMKWKKVRNIQRTLKLNKNEKFFGKVIFSHVYYFLFINFKFN